METHVKVLGILFVALGVLGLIGVLVIALVFGGTAGIVSIAAQDDPEAAAIAVPVLGTIGVAIGGLILVLSLPDILAGIGLLERRPWARTRPHCGEWSSSRALTTLWEEWISANWEAAIPMSCPGAICPSYG